MISNHLFKNLQIFFHLLWDKDQNSLCASNTQGHLPTDFLCSSFVLQERTKSDSMLDLLI